MHTLLAIVMVLVFAFFAAANEPAAEIIAHRGASYDAPENTLAAIRLAWRQHADAAELDVHLTKDGQLCVLHDKDTKRVAGVNFLVSGTPFAELRKLDVGSWKDRKFRDERIPSLAEILATVPDKKRVFIEIKCGPECVAELDRVLKASHLKPQQTPVISFHADVVAAVKKARPDLAAYWIVSLKKEKPPSAAQVVAKCREINADGVDLSACPALDEAYADVIKMAGLPLYVWTVNDVNEARRMLRLGAVGITTDRPGWLREQLAK
jgi:glycerophosphoryl diester phosphodiesterase